jgi:hypothetical protein
MPRYSHGYGDLRHLPTILVECHSLKPYRQRVLGTYVLVEAALKTLGAGASEVAAAIAADRGARPSTLLMNDSAPDGDPSAIDFQGIAYETYLSPASGRKEVRWLGTPKVFPALPLNRTKPKLSLRRPKAYWVPVSKPDVIGRLRLHGIQLEVLSAARTNTLEMYRLENLKPQPGSGVHPFEGRHTLTTGVKAEQRTEVFPAGSVRVPTDQPLGDLAMALLEPEGDDSLFAWGFFLEVLQRTEYMEGYVLAPMAERMLAEDPALQAAFEAKLAAEPAFAANPTARLQWFYQRSPYYDARHLLYPVGIER